MADFEYSLQTVATDNICMKQMQGNCDFFSNGNNISSLLRQ